VEDWALEGYQRNKDEAAANPAEIGSYTNVHGVGDAMKYLREAVAENLPSMAPSLLTGGVGGVLARKAAEKAALPLVERKIAEGVARDAAEKAAAAQVARATTAGATAGALPATIGQNTGEIYGDILDDTGQKAPGTALLYGTAAGALDVLPESALLRRALVRPGQETTSALRRYGTDAAKQFGLEGSTEGAQEILSAMASHSVDPTQAVFTPQNNTRFIDAALKGGLAGGGMSTAANIISPSPQPSPPAPQQNPRDELLSQAADLVRRHDESKLLLSPPGPTTVPAGSGPSIENTIAQQRASDEATQKADQLYAERDAEEKRRTEAFTALGNPQTEPAPAPAAKSEGLELADPQKIFAAVTARPAIFETIRKAAEALPEPKAETEIDTRPDVRQAIKEMEADPQAIFSLARSKPEIFQTIAKMASEVEQIAKERQTYPREHVALDALVKNQPITPEDLAYLVQAKLARQDREGVRALPAGRRRLVELNAAAAEFAGKTPLELEQAAKLTRSTEKRDAITAEIDRREQQPPAEVTNDGHVQSAVQEPVEAQPQQAQQQPGEASGNAPADESHAGHAQNVDEGRQAGVLSQEPPPGAQERAKERSNRFLKMVAGFGGVNTQHALDITGEKNLVRFGGLAGRVFRKNGLGINTVATYLHERGYISDAEYNDVDGGSQRARDLLREAVNGTLEPITEHESQTEYEAMRADAAMLADREEANVGERWATMSEDEKNAELDTIFGADTADQNVPAQRAAASTPDSQNAARQEVPATATREVNDTVPPEDNAPSGERQGAPVHPASESGFGLVGETRDGLTARAQQSQRDATAKAEAKALADREAPHFGLTASEGSTSAQPLNEAKNQQDLLAAPAEKTASSREDAGGAAPSSSSPAEPAPRETSKPAPNKRKGRVKPLSAITVETRAVEAETGRTIYVKEKADIALKEVDDDIAKTRLLLECLRT
jgi:hypothetical protein